MNKNCLRAAIRYAALAAFCLVFHLVYAQFSHGTRSPFMTFLWAIPLGLGTLVFLFCGRLFPVFPAGVPLWLYNAGVGTLTAGSLVMGVLEIADAASDFMIVYPIAGGALLLAGIVWQIVRILRRRTARG